MRWVLRRFGLVGEEYQGSWRSGDMGIVQLQTVSNSKAVERRVKSRICLCSDIPCVSTVSNASQSRLMRRFLTRHPADSSVAPALPRKTPVEPDAAFPYESLFGQLHNRTRRFRKKMRSRRSFINPKRSIPQARGFHQRGGLSFVPKECVEQQGRQRRPRQRRSQHTRLCKDSTHAAPYDLN